MVVDNDEIDAVKAVGFVCLLFFFGSVVVVDEGGDLE